MPEIPKLKNQLNKILESEQFSRSSINVSLLSLLFDATIEGRRLKEATIGSEVFGKQYDPVKNDTKVRVYIHNLRKRLAAYYESEGKNDVIVFEIEKGEYRVVFKTPNSKVFYLKKWSIYISLLVVLLSVVLFSIFMKVDQPNDFWSGLLADKFPTTLLVGDHFTIESQVPTGGSGVFRDFSINSEQEFSQHLQKHPEHASMMVPNEYPYVTKMGPYCTRMLTLFLAEHQLPFELMLNSKWDKTKVTEENIVYVGQFKTMGFLKNLFTDSFPNYEVFNGRILRNDSVSNRKDSFHSNAGNEIVDYTIVAKMHGPVENDILMFLSDNDIGVIRLVEYYTTLDSLNGFYSRNHLKGRDFAALYKVSGWERTGYKMELVELDVK